MFTRGVSIGFKLTVIFKGFNSTNYIRLELGKPNKKTCFTRIPCILILYEKTRRSQFEKLVFSISFQTHSRSWVV